MKEKIEEIANLLFEHVNPIPKNWRFFLVDESSYLYLNEAVIEHAPNYTIDTDWKNVPDRGDLLDRFAKFEFLITELIRLTITGFVFENGTKLIDVMNQNTRTKINYLQKWNIIDKKITKKLSLLFEIRNGLAHKFDSADVHYEGLILSTSTTWTKFKQDMKECWLGLITAYLKEEEKIDFDKLKQKIKELKIRVFQVMLCVMICWKMVIL